MHCGTNYSLQKSQMSLKTLVGYLSPVNPQKFFVDCRFFVCVSWQQIYFTNKNTKYFITSTLQTYFTN